MVKVTITTPTMVKVTITTPTMVKVTVTTPTNGQSYNNNTRHGQNYNNNTYHGQSYNNNTYHSQKRIRFNLYVYGQQTCRQKILHRTTGSTGFIPLHYVRVRLKKTRGADNSVVADSGVVGCETVPVVGFKN